MVGIDLFAGAGGLSLGAQYAGVTVTHAVESNTPAVQTYRRNHPSTVMIHADIRCVDPPKNPKSAPLVLFGGPPCRGFSTSNQRTRSEDNSQNWLFQEFFRFAACLHPDWIVLENVKGLRETAQGKFEALIFAGLRKLGYETVLWTLCAVDYGVPQKRDRLFFVGRRYGRLPDRPPREKKPAITVRNAISDLPVLTVGASTDELTYRLGRPSVYARAMRQGASACSGHLVTANNRLVQKRYSHIPPGGNWQDIPRALMRNYSNLTDKRSRHTGIYRRLRWDEPSVVIANYRKNMLLHPEQDRGLSVREACRLQSFPDSYQFAGSIGFQQQQVSNAVPPLLAKAVFCAIVAAS
jgi:DNA (cytosine-5)-methyltransferase 1